MMKTTALRLSALLLAALVVPLQSSARSTDALEDGLPPAPATARLPVGAQIWDRPEGPAPAVTAPRAQPVRVMSSNPLWGIPLDALSATRERPIFSASRRPRPAAVSRIAPPKTPPPPRPVERERPQLSLVGTIAGGDESFAIFVDGSRAALRLRIGEDYQGWILRAVEGREATLEKGAQATVLTLPQPGKGGGEIRTPSVAAGGADVARAPSAAQEVRCRVKSHESCYD